MADFLELPEINGEEDEESAVYALQDSMGSQYVSNKDDPDATAECVGRWTEVMGEVGR